MIIIILLHFLLMAKAQPEQPEQSDQCGAIQQSGSTSCHDCVEITILGVDQIVPIVQTHILV